MKVLMEQKICLECGHKDWYLVSSKMCKVCMVKALIKTKRKKIHTTNNLIITP